MNYYPKINIKCLAECHSLSEENYTRHRLFEVIWFTETPKEGIQLIDHEQFPVKEHTVVLLAKNQVYQLQPGYKGYSITFTPVFFQMADNRRFRVLFNPFLNDPVELDSVLSDHLIAIFKMIEMENNTTADQRVVNGYFSLFLHKISVVTRTNVYKGKNLSRLQDLMELIETHYTKERSASFYAEKIGVTSKRLNQILKERTTLTVTQLIHRMLITEAKRMIANGDHTMKQIAFDLGFNEQPYFNRFFKKVTGLTPEQFQKKTRKLNC